MRKKILVIALFFFILATPSFSASDSDVQINLTVTNPETPPIAPVTPGGGGSLPVEKIPPKIFSLTIVEIDTVSAKIGWETNELAVCTLFWGLSNDYEKASLGEISFWEKHLTVLKNLFPGHLYHFKIKCSDLARNTAETEDQIFYTLSLPDNVPPPNVSNFKAAPGIEKIALSWKNPDSPDFKGIKILRKTDFYSTNPQDGIVVYEKENTAGFENYMDVNLKAGVKQYYTLYAFDESKNYSSGALASSVPLKKPETKIFLPPVPPTPAPLSAAPIVPIVSITTTPIFVLDISKDLEFYQDNKKIIPVNGQISVDSGKELLVLIVENKILDSAKAVIIKIGTGAESSYYLLNKTKDGKYSAVIILSKEGNVKITVEAIGQNDQLLSRGEKSLTVKKMEQGGKTAQYWGYWVLLTGFYLLILLLVLLFLYKRRKKKEDKSQK